MSDLSFGRADDTLLSAPVERIAKYEIVRLLGKGSMGRVYLAHDVVLDRDVALKLMGYELEEPELADRFVREARAVARLAHPNVVAAYDLGYHTDGKPYIAMELLRGDDLQKAMRRDPPLPLDQKVAIILQVLAGLGHAHEQGIVHRDVKPANVFVTVEGTAKIMDFGVARFTSTAAPATGTGTVVGTADYMSPEQVRGFKVDGRSDLFSVGCMLFELVTRHRPFHADSLMAIFYMITHEEPDYDLVPPGREHDALLPLIKKALTKDPDHRYQTAAQFAAELRSYLDAYASYSGSAAPANRRRHARMNVDLPVRVEGWDAAGEPWVEATTTEDASLGGGGFRLQHPVSVGQVLRLSLSLPRQFRKYDLGEATYVVYAQVRSLFQGRAGVLFLGKDPPSGFADNQGGAYTVPSERSSAVREFPRFEVSLDLRVKRRIEGSQEEEWTTTENIGQGGALLRSTLRAVVGETIELEEVEGRFRTRAEVRNVTAGRDGFTRINVNFLDADCAGAVLLALQSAGASLGVKPPRPMAAAHVVIDVPTVAAPAMVVRHRVLVVEDSPVVAAATRSMLQGAAWEVEHADRMAAALTRLAEPGIDVVLLDLNLPDSKGVETVRRVCAGWPDVPVVVLTGHDDEATGVLAVRHGAQDFLVKGEVDAALLGRFLRSSIARKRAALDRDRQVIPQAAAVSEPPKAEPPPLVPDRLERAPAEAQGPVVATAARPAPRPVPLGEPVAANGLPALLKELAASGKTGAIVFHAGGERRALWFRQGAVVAVDSTAAGEGLDDVMLRLGTVDRDGLATARAMAEKEHHSLGAVLQHVLGVDAARIQEAVARRIREVLAVVAGSTELRWTFQQDPVPAAADVTDRVALPALLLDVVREARDPTFVAEALGDLQRSLRRAPGAGAIMPKLWLTSTDGYLLSRVDGTLSAHEVLELVPLPLEDASRILLGLVTAGLLEFGPRHAAPAPRPVAPPRIPDPPPASVAAPPVVPPPDDTSGVLTRQQLLDAYTGLSTRGPLAILGLTSTATEADVRASYARMVRQFHPDAHRGPAFADVMDKMVAVFVRLGEINKLLQDPDTLAHHRREASRREYQEALAARNAEARAAQAAPSAPRPEPVFEPAVNPAVLVKSAERLIAADKYWDAVQVLEEAMPLAAGKMRLRVRVMLAGIYLKNPRWRRQAEELLQLTIREDPKSAEAHYLLGTLYAEVGLKNRAGTAFRKVLELQPDHAEASARLQQLFPSIDRPSRA